MEYLADAKFWTFIHKKICRTKSMTHCTENPFYIFPETKLRGLIPNSYSHVSVSNVYRIGQPVLLQPNLQTNPVLGIWAINLSQILYQIRRPPGLAFVISFVGWENCCRSIFSWTLICSSLPHSPDLLGFPATYPPPPHIDSGTSLEP